MAGAVRIVASGAEGLVDSVWVVAANSTLDWPARSSLKSPIAPDEKANEGAKAVS